MLRDLIEKIDAREPIFPVRMTDEQIRHVEKLARNAGERAVCFYAGDMDELSHLKVIRPLVRLPFEVCWVEMDAKSECGGNFISGYLLWNFEGLINGQVWIKKPADEWIYCYGFQKTEDGKNLIVHYIKDADPYAYQSGICSVELFLTALNCSNVRRKENKPDSALQISRAKKGKKPLFSYWTLDVLMPNSGPKQSGTARSGSPPRVHLRRGHPREYKPGVYCWVQPCVVGKVKEGMVTKDYAAKWAGEARA